jgi:RES domain-containing protein
VPEFVGFRVASWDRPLRVNPNRQPGRWNRTGSAPTQYIALHPLASWAEYLRWHDLREPAQIREIRLGVWAIRVIVDDVRVVRYDTASSIGLRAEDLVDDDWTRCQTAADRLRSDRSAPKVLQTPSAALPGALNVVILGPRVAIPYRLEPIDSGDLPVTLAAAGARPPTSLLDLVRYRGEKHPELAAWQRGERFELIEPDDALVAEDARSET